MAGYGRKAFIMGKRVILANPRGFCAGVDRAIATVRTILKAADSDRTSASEGAAEGAAEGNRAQLPPVYVRRQIVHNRHVVAELAEQGAVFVQELDEIPDSAAQAHVPIVFSAHGVSPSVKDEAARRGLNVVDATCPLVAKVHREVLRFAREGYEIIYIGHRGHDEAVGVVGEAPARVHLVENEADVDALSFAPDAKLVYLSQTTLSIEETEGLIAHLHERFPGIVAPPSSDICYATSNRQAAVKAVAKDADCVIVVGSANSSNSVRLVEVANESMGDRGHAHRVDDAGELDPSWFDGVHAVGVTSGASVPEQLVDGVVDALAAWGFDEVRAVDTIEENMHFVLPPQLRAMMRQRA